jgi:hypothetical protein
MSVSVSGAMPLGPCMHAQEGRADELTAEGRCTTYTAAGLNHSIAEGGATLKAVPHAHAHAHACYHTSSAVRPQGRQRSAQHSSTYL